MAESIPGFSAIKETEENQVWASGPDNNHKRFEVKGKIASTVTDSGNTGNTTTIRGGRIMGVKNQAAEDGLLYLYDADNSVANQVVGILPKHLSMLDKDGTAEAKFTKILTQGIIKNVDDLLGSDLAALAVLLRSGFTLAAKEPHGSQFLVAPKARYFKDGTGLSGAYTVLSTDHGCLLTAVTAGMNFTMPDLATVGRGFSVWLFNAVDATMVVTGAANTIQTGDAGGAQSTTITFSTANRKMGASVLMYADYASEAGSLCWLPLVVSGSPTYA